MILLPANLAGLHALTAVSGRFTIGSVSLTATPEGYTAVVTDGKALLAVEGKPPAPAEEFPIALPPTGVPASSALIPAKAWRDAFRSIPKRGKPALRCVAVEMGVNESTLATTDLERQNVALTRNVEGYFPEWQGVIPKDSPKATVTLSAARLVELLKALLPLTDMNSITLEVRKESSPIVIRAESADQKITAILSPIS